MNNAASPVRFSHVTKQFTETVRGLDDVTVDTTAGQITVLLGLSGSGKSTFLRHVNGLQQPTSGEITVLGQRVDNASPGALRKLRREIGFIFQHFHLVGPMSVLENVCSGQLGSLSGPRLSLLMYPKQIRLAAMAQLERVGLADRAYQRADTLSGGQQQRVAIARALIQKPKILLADEPVASLDPISSVQVTDLIREIAHEEQLTVMCSLHQVQLAMSFADRIVGLAAGKVVLDENTADMDSDAAFAVYDKVSGKDASPHGSEDDEDADVVAGHSPRSVDVRDTSKGVAS